MMSIIYLQINLEQKILAFLSPFPSFFTYNNFLLFFTSRNEECQKNRLVLTLLVENIIGNRKREYGIYWKLQKYCQKFF